MVDQEHTSPSHGGKPSAVRSPYSGGFVGACSPYSGEFAGACSPYRGEFGAPRPPALSALALPPEPMPAWFAKRPLKAWRYLALCTPEATVCVARVRVGPMRDGFWAVWDRGAGRLWRGAGVTAGQIEMLTGGARVRTRRVEFDVWLEETSGVETICPCGAAYGWTRKQGAIPAAARIDLDGRRLELVGQAIIDDTAAYYPRHTSWRWSAGVGRTSTGRQVAWNLVDGVNDPPSGSERTVWVDGVAGEAPRCQFAADLSGVDELHFQPEAEVARRTNLGVVRSRYRQPIGRFSGCLPGGHELAEGYGVMERHEAWW